MLRIRENFGRWAGFHNLTVFHHAHSVRNLTNDCQIVGNEKQAHLLALFQVCQQIKNLSLNGHIQRGRRFICDQQFRIVGQRHGDHHTLPLST